MKLCLDQASFGGVVGALSGIQAVITSELAGLGDCGSLLS